ncbi:lipoprotein [Spiroplasma sp. DGKH1]|uniref:lipoprotein n=1 Tax=Spiroplasma sp. DGKH1 TaxID=3050074 RepID=UPI0034C5F683
MKKLLAILGAVGLTATGASSVVACNGEKSSEKNPSTLDGKTFQTSLAELNKITKDNSASWGSSKDALGYLISTLASINNKSAIADGYNIQNTKVAEYLHQGESVKWEVPVTIKDKDGKDVTLDATDTNKTPLKEGYLIKMTLTVLTYKKDDQGQTVVDKTFNPIITMTITA